MVADTVEKEIVALRVRGEIFPGVVDHAIGAEGADPVEVPRTAHAGNFCAERSGDLHRECADATGGSVDQDLLPRFEAAVVAETLQSSQGGHERGSCLLEC